MAVHRDLESTTPYSRVLPKSSRKANPVLRISLLLLLPGLSLVAQESPHSVRFDVAHGKPFVMVKVNGKGPFRFVIDTGTGAEAFVTPELAADLDLPLAGLTKVSDPSGQSAQQASLVAIQSLKVAGVEFTGIRAVRHALPDDDGVCQGLLGFALFRNYLLTLDFPRKQLTLSNGSLSPDGERSVLSFRMPRGIPIISLQVGGLTTDAQLDSGGAGLSLPEKLATHLKFSVEPVLFGNSRSLSSKFQVRAGTLAADVTVGQYTFTRPFVEINAAFPLINFGSCAMQSFAFTFDQRNHLVRFESNRHALHLAATPAPMHIDNSPFSHTQDLSLIPVG